MASSKVADDVDSSLGHGDATTAFAISLYQLLSVRDSKTNICFSPFSVYTALGMVYLGSRGRTADQMRKALNVRGNLEGPGFHTALRQVKDTLVSSEKHILQIANRLFGQKGSNIMRKYLDGTKLLYDAEMEALDFSENAEAASRCINSWIEDQTSGKIKQAVDASDLPGTLLLLVNAIYFKGKWKKPFEDSCTWAEDFFVTTEDIREVLFMHHQAIFGYYNDTINSCKVLELPYERDGMSMLVVLPNKVDGIVSLESILSVGLLDQWVASLQECTVDVSLPRLNFEHSTELREPLTRLGMGELFQAGAADLSGISDSQSLHVSRVVHKAFIDVNEEGTEAAAATIAYIPTSPSYHLNEFRADHPFLFAIRNMSSGVYLFLGRVHCPQSS